MPLDLPSIFAGKQAYRRQLAARPIGEKLRMLDALRERELAIRGHAVRPNGTNADPAGTDGSAELDRSVNKQ